MTNIELNELEGEVATIKAGRILLYEFGKYLEEQKEVKKVFETTWRATMTKHSKGYNKAKKGLNKLRRLKP